MGKGNEIVSVAMNEEPNRYQKGVVYDLPIDEIVPNPYQARKHFDDDAIQELAFSIEKHGLIQPVSFTVQNDKIVLVSGERRLKACREILKREMIWGILNEGDPEQIAIAENLYRQDLTAIEEAEALKKYAVSRNLSNEQLAEELKKAKSTISEILSLYRLPEEIRNECRGDHKIPRRILVEIAKKKHPKGMMSAYKKYRDKQLSRDELRGMVKKRKVPRSNYQIYMELFEDVKEKIGAIQEGSFSDTEEKSLHQEAISLIASLMSKFKVYTEEFGAPKSY